MKSEGYKGVRVALLGLVLAALIAGCVTTSAKQDATDIVDRAMDELGVPVFYWALSDDVCAAQQAVFFKLEFDRLPGKQREFFVEKIRSTYRSIIVEATSASRPDESRGTIIEKGASLVLRPVRLDGKDREASPADCGEMAALSEVF